MKVVDGGASGIGPLCEGAEKVKLTVTGVVLVGCVAS
jgi:hypothetical protein